MGRFLFLEPFFGGSHRDFAIGWQAHSRHRIELLTLPARFWKWRMRGAALYFARKIPDISVYDGLIVTGLMSLSDLLALSPQAPPALLYFHENQLDYPLSAGEQMDYQYGFTNIISGLSARQVLFNSHTHFRRFFETLPRFLAMMPDYPVKWATAAIKNRAGVLYPGCHFSPLPEQMADMTGPPIILWNHRWEHDKDPATFFDVLSALAKQGLGFRLAILGEQFARVPPVFEAARGQFAEQIVQYGFVSSRTEYQNWLKRAAIVVSTAKQENFGISVVEAIGHGCLPLLPDRLSYPEILPSAYQDRFLYRSRADMLDKLAELLIHYEQYAHLADELCRIMRRFDWKNVINGYDKALDGLR